MICVLLWSVLVITFISANVSASSGFDGGELVLQLHGSGTEVASFCYWNVLDEIQSDTNVPVRLTYRTVSDEIALDELAATLGAPDPDLVSGQERVVYSSFMSTDIALSSSAFNSLNDNGEGDTVESNESVLVQLPVLAKAVSFYSSEPTLRLSSCALSRIFTQKVTFWGEDPEVIDLNPNTTSIWNFPIRIAVYDSASSAQLAITTYLSQSCPEEFDEVLENELPVWSDFGSFSIMNDPNSPGYVNVSTQFDMIEAIRTTPGTIGFSATVEWVTTMHTSLNHGDQKDGGFLVYEVSIPNSEGTYLTSRQSADDYDGIGAAVTRDSFPDTPDLNYDGVQFINRPGTYTWPIVLVMYILVPKDISNILRQPMERSLLYAVLNTMYDEDYTSICRNQYYYSTLSPEIQEFGKIGIELVQNYPANNYSDARDAWYFEKDSSEQSMGNERYVISHRQNNLAISERIAMRQEINALLSQIQQLKDDIDSKQSSISKLEEKIISVQDTMDTKSLTSNELDNTGAMLLDDDIHKQLKSALILSTVSMVFVILILLMIASVMLYTYNSNKKKDNKNTSTLAYDKMSQSDDIYMS